jgi:flavin reductase (DIM6/NTAB) family NADH-FMN oxidoreductase RutF
MSDAIGKALRLMVYGYYVITSKAGDEVNAMSANWVIQTSFEPRQVVLALQKTAFSHGLVEASRVFAINIFAQADADIVKKFMKSREKRPDKMADAVYTPAPQTGVPVIDGAAAYVECRVVAIYDTGGDHDLVVGEVVGGELLKAIDGKDSLSLTHHLGWDYGG